MFGKKLNIISDHNYHYHIHPDNFIDRIWKMEDNPRQISGHIINGWHQYSSSPQSYGFYWCRKGIIIDAFIESFDNKNLEWENYNRNIPILDWYLKEIPEWEEIFLNKIS
jgi:hypothetical protein